MNRVEAAFAGLKAAGRKGIVPFVCGGRPTPAAFRATLHALERAGSTVIEVGVPFSDPIADGPVIARAMHEALGAGVTPGSVMAEVRRAREEGLGAPVVAMVSVSLVHRAGPERFTREAAAAGFDGLIVPDAPLEESGPCAAAAREAGLTLSLLVAPSSAPDRAARIASASTGFVYMLARAGLTGESADAPDVAPRVRALRGATALPIACGFGISTAEQVRAVVGEGGAEAAIVGSALVRRLEEAGERGAADAAHKFVDALSAGL